MTTEKDIHDQIQRDVQAYNNKIYDGFLPDFFMDKFKQALMVVPPGQHQYNMSFVKELIAKRNDEISVVEVGVIINLIYVCPFERIYQSLDEGIETTIAFDKVRDEYNKKNAEFEKTIMRKQKKLLEIAGLTKSIPFNGTKIAQA